MPVNQMQPQMSPDMLMAMMTDPRGTPQQRMAAMNALNAMRGGANAPVPPQMEGGAAPPQMTGDSTGVSQMSPAFMAAVRQEMMGQGPEEKPEIKQRKAPPEAEQNPTTAALMSGAADAGKVAAMARGGAVRGYNEGGPPASVSAYLKQLVQPQSDDPLAFIKMQLGEGNFEVGTDGRLRLPPQTQSYPKPDVPQQSLMAGPDEALGNSSSAPIPPPSAPIAAPVKVRAAPPTDIVPPPPPKPEVPAEPGEDKAALKARMQAESDDYKERINKLMSDDQPLSNRDNGMALMRAGAAIMAGKSPNAMMNIGEGVKAGVEGLNEMREKRAIHNMKQATFMQAQRNEQLTQEARNRQLDISEGALGVEKRGIALKEQENDPTSPMGKAKLDNAIAMTDYYKAVAIKSARPEKASEAVDKFTLLTGPGGMKPEDAALVIAGQTPKGMSEDQKKSIALKQAMDAHKEFLASPMAATLKAKDVTERAEKIYRDSYLRALNLLNEDVTDGKAGGTLPPPKSLSEFGK